jgi:hypothetical protein
VLPGEPVVRLRLEGGFGPGDGEALGLEGGDARPGVGELLPDGGNVAVELGEPDLGLGGPGGRSQVLEPLVALAVGLGQRGPGLLALLAGGVGGGAEAGVFRVGLFCLAARGGVERVPQRGPVVVPVGHVRELLRVGGQGREVGAPPVGPVGELVAGAGYRAPADPEPTGPVEHDLGGRAGGVAFVVPGEQQVVADPVAVGGDRCRAGLRPLVGLLGGDRRPLPGGLQPVEFAGVGRLKFDDLA